MEMKDWSKDPVTTVGSWLEEPLEKTMGVRTYKSDYTPYDQNGEAAKLTHTGTYLKVQVAGKYVAFHKQLKEDDLGIKVDGFRFHVHHKDKNEKNNHSEHLEVKRKQGHLNEHAREGGRPFGKRKIQWSAAKRR